MANKNRANQYKDKNVSFDEKKLDNQSKSVSNKITRERPKSRIRRGQRLYAEQREGFERRFVRDDAGRIEQFQAGGWEIVTKESYLGERRDDEPSRETTAISSVPAGGGSNLVLMEIPKEWYDESKDEEQKEINAVEQGILHQLDSETGETSSGNKSTIGRVVIGER